MQDSDPTRRRVLRTGAAALAAGVGVGSLGSVAARGNDNGKQFGRVWANDILWRTNVVRTLDEEPEPNDVIYFVNDGTTASLPGGGGTANAGASPFVSESAPGDRDWNGGQWVHKAATLDDGVTLSEPLTSAADVRAAEEDGQLTIADRRPYLEGTTTPFGPPRYFLCPLNGRA